MAVLNGVDEAGAFTLYDVPDTELAKYKLNTKPLTDEIRNKLFPEKDTVTKDDAQGVIPAGRSSGGGSDVEGYAAGAGTTSRTAMATGSTGKTGAERSRVKCGARRLARPALRR